jgi:pimeloyl-ACP methyl ester carboxylesterase
VGERDETFLDHAEELLAHLPRARLVTFEGAGHDLTLERPAELAAILTEDEA